MREHPHHDLRLVTPRSAPIEATIEATDRSYRPPIPPPAAASLASSTSANISDISPRSAEIVEAIEPLVAHTRHSWTQAPAHSSFISAIFSAISRRYLGDILGGFSQTSDEFHLTVHVGTGVHVANLSVRVRPRHVHVAAAGHVLLSGSLWRAVRPRK